MAKNGDPKLDFEARETIVDADVPTIIEDGANLPQILTSGFVEEFERGVEVYKRWISACYRLTRESHWINHGSADKPKYSLQGPGAEALMNPLGISFDKYTARLVPLEGAAGGYAYWVEGYMESKTLRRRGYYIGYCDSRDQFFNARAGWKPETGHGDVQKSAVTNWIVNGVTRLAGLRDPSPESLHNAGLDTTKIVGINYRGDKTAEQSTGMISEPQSKRLWAICKNHNVSETMLKAYLEKIHKIKSSKEITRAIYDDVCGWAEFGGPPTERADEDRSPGEEG